MGINIYDQTAGFCTDKAQWILEQKILQLNRTDIPKEHEITVPLTELGDSVDCVTAAIELLQAKGWRIAKYYFLSDKLVVVVEV